MTEEELKEVEDLEAKLQDPIWRISNLYTIIDKKGRKVPFRPNPEQKDLMERMHTRNVILKARQIGFTTLCCIIYLDDCLFNPNVSVALIAHRLPDAERIFQEKVRDVYNDLPDIIKNRVQLTRDSSMVAQFSNGSAFRVSTSTRSGTVQYLHISEYGKICAQFPDKAREIRTGAFPSAEQGVITIESTAEGNGGDFYTKCTEAELLEQAGKELSRLDYKFFFYPWWCVEEYQIAQSVVPQSPDDVNYFEGVEQELGITISEPKRNWWMAQERDLGGDMKREYPASPAEAFEQAIEGAYFTNQISYLYKKKRIGNYPIDPRFAINSAWDLGRNDHNVIWLWQDIGRLHVFVGYYQNHNEWIGHYVDWLRDFRETNGITYGVHYLPHDGDVKTIWTPGGSMDTMAQLKFYPTVVPRTPDILKTINVARGKFPLCAFDEGACKEGLDLLKKYRKQYDEKYDTWRNVPVHDEASHAASGFMTFAESNHTLNNFSHGTNGATSRDEEERQPRYQGWKNRKRASSYMGV